MKTVSAFVLPSALAIGWVFVTMLLWAFAFWHAPEATPEWLLRAQAACFGRTESGLPDTAGWLMLTLAPLLLLASLVTALWSELRGAFEHWRRSKAAQIVVALVILVVGVEGWWVLGRIAHGLRVRNADFASNDQGVFPQWYPTLKLVLPSFAELVDQHGERVDSGILRDRPVILSFAFAHCRSVCPAIVRTIGEARRSIPADGVDLVFITLDPWRDTPRALRELAVQWGLASHDRVLSGEPAAVNRVLAALNVRTERDERTGDITHPALIYVLAPDGTTAYALNNPPVSWVVEAVARLGNGSAGAGER